MSLDPCTTRACSAVRPEASPTIEEGDDDDEDGDEDVDECGYRHSSSAGNVSPAALAMARTAGTFPQRTQW